MAGEKGKRGGKRSGAGRKYKQDVITKVMRVPETDVKTVQVLIDMIHAHAKNRPYKYTNEEIIELIDTLEWTISAFRNRVQNGELENLDDIPLRYKINGI